MITSSLAGAQAELFEALRDVLGAEHVIDAPDELAFYSTDVYRRADVDAVLVVRPGAVHELAEVVRLCVESGLPVVPRGGGLSYTGGFLPVRDGTVIIDLQRLNRIVEINPTDMYVTVECGATWKTVYEALDKLGLRTPYFGPMSGFASTVGGALSQGSIFLGSTQHGTTADSVLGLDVVIADGSVLTTGSAGGTANDNPFFRNYGPDLTGLFLHDAGALGLKARATLRLIPTPEHVGFVSFTFSSFHHLLAAQSKIARRGLAAECYGADPYIWGMRLWDEDISRDITRVFGVVKAGRTLVQGIKDALRMAISGRRSLQDVEYAMNVAVDGRSQNEVDLLLDEIRKIAASHGKEIPSTVPRAVRGSPFVPPNDLLGPAGQRWAPSHGIAPHSCVVPVVEALHRFFKERVLLLEQHGIEWGYVTFAISNNAILVEPMLYWPDARESYHERMITPAYLEKLPRLPANPAAAATMRDLRRDLTLFWLQHGCAHLQIGKTYRYMESRQPIVRRLLEQIKAAVDPEGLINPGALGFSE